MANADSTFAREAWRLVATGGWWKAPEIIQRVPLEVSISQAYSVLHSMSTRDGTLVRRGETKAFEYAVTQDCKPPRGLTVAEILQAVGGAA